MNEKIKEEKDLNLSFLNCGYFGGSDAYHVLRKLLEEKIKKFLKEEILKDIQRHKSIMGNF